MTSFSHGCLRSFSFFKEVVDVGVLLLSQLFKQLAIVDTPLLLTSITCAIVDLLFKLIGTRTDTAEATIMALRSKDPMEYLCFRENEDDE